MKTRNISFIFMVSILIITTLACSTAGFQTNTPAAQEGLSSNEKTTIASTLENNVSRSTHTPAPTSTPSQAPVGSARSNPAPAGSEITADGIMFIVKSAIRPADDVVKQGYSTVNKPEEGQEFVFVELSLTCIKSSDGKCSFSRYKSGLLGSKGIKREALYIAFYQPLVAHTPTPSPKLPEILADTDFYGGASIAGFVLFLVDKDETDLLLVYEFQADRGEREIYMSLPEPTQ